MISELPALGVRFTISNASGCIAYDIRARLHGGEF